MSHHQPKAISKPCCGKCAAPASEAVTMLRGTTTPRPRVALEDMTISDIVRELPDALPLFTGLGLDTCCGGALTLREAVEKHRLDGTAVLTALGPR